MKAMQMDKNGKPYLKLDVWSVRKSSTVEYFRIFRLKNFKPNREYLSKVLDKYEIPGI